MRFLPVFLDLHGRRVALAGDGPAARNKLRLLQSAGAAVRWYGDEHPGAGTAAVEAAAGASGSGTVEISAADLLCADFSEFAAVIVAADHGRAAEIAAQARRCNVPVNVIDRPGLSTFIFPAIVDRGDVVVAIGTGGTAPVLARRLRERIEALLPARIGDLAALMGRFRAAAARTGRNTRALRRFWEWVADGPIAAAALAGRWRDAEIALARAVTNGEWKQPQAGMVYLVGAGPGDADLLTLRALRVLQSADIIFYDELVTAAVLARARRDATLVFVGKRAGRPGLSQDAINERLVEAARQGMSVVRLKCGDPFIFGRGGEELAYLRQADIAVEIVPGVTAAIGCAAEAGLPLTFRKEATQLTLVSASHADGDTETDWSRCAGIGTTLVVYMGLGKAAAVRDGLIAAGRDPATPAAVLASATRPEANYLVGRLDQIAALATRAGDGPGLIVVGEAVAHSDIWRAAAVAESGRKLTEMAA